MSENAMHLQIVTPHGCSYDAKTLGVRVESLLGQMELLPDHEPMIAALDIGAAVVVLAVQRHLDRRAAAGARRLGERAPDLGGADNRRRDRKSVAPAARAAHHARLRRAHDRPRPWGSHVAVAEYCHVGCAAGVRAARCDGKGRWRRVRP